MKFILKLLLLSSIITITGLANAEEIKVAATEYPNAVVLEHIKPALAKQGYDLHIIHYQSYNNPFITYIRAVPDKGNPNWELAEGNDDANFFQHDAYMNLYNKRHKTNLVSVADIFFVPVGLISAKANTNVDKSLSNLKGASIAIPDSPINESRALKLLAANKIIVLDNKKANPEIEDVIQNPYNVKLYRLDPTVIPTSLKNHTVDFAILNLGRAHLAHLPLQNVVLTEHYNQEYANTLVTRSDEINQAKIKALKAALQSADTKQFIKQNLNGIAVPAF